MKKESFQGMLAIMGGLTGAFLFWGAIYRILRLPGGMILLLIALVLGIVWCVSQSCYVLKHGALKQLVEKGVAGAKHLLNIECAAFIALAFGFVAAYFFSFHIRGDIAWDNLMLVISFTMFAILSFLAGIFASKVLKNK